MMYHLGKKPQKWSRALDTVQKHVVLPCKRNITPVKTSFAYPIYFFLSIIENKVATNYLYGSVDNILDIIRDLMPSLTDWSVTSTAVMTMRRIVGSIVKNQASGEKWLISEAIVDTVRVYIYLSGDEVNEVLKL